MKRSKRLRKWIMTLASALVTLALCACSDGGRVRYADEAFVRELCGLPAVEEPEALEGTGDGQGEGTGAGAESTGEGTGIGSGEDSGTDTGEGSSIGEGSGEGSDTGSGEGLGSGEGSGNGEASGADTGEGTGTGDGSGDGTGEGTDTTMEALDEGALEGTAIGEGKTADERIRERMIGAFLSTPISVRDEVYDAMTQASWLEPYLELDDTKLVITARFTFDAQGRAKLAVEEESYGELMDYLTKEVTDATYRYFDSYAKKISSFLTTKQYLDMMGISLENYVGDIIREAGGELDEAAMSYESYYAVRGERIYLGESVEELSEGRRYLTFLMRGSLLTLMGYFEDEKPQEKPLGMNVTLPLSLTKLP